MIKIVFRYFSLFVFLVCMCNTVFAENCLEAEDLLKKAQRASIKEEGYEYINAARKLYTAKYDENPSDIDVLLGLSKTYQMLGQRKEARLYILKAYNMKPYEPSLQREMGDFYYNFQEYSTAIEYYKLALASGLLEDFDTNLITAKCYEKLGDLDNSKLYYQICAHLNPKSKKVSAKLNTIDSEEHNDNSEELENAKYKYLFKRKKLSESEKNDVDADTIIEQINSLF